MGEIEIKQIGTADSALLSEVALRAYADHYLHLWHDGGKWYTEKFFSEEHLAKELSDVNTFFCLAYHNKVPVGFLKLNIDAPLNGEALEKALELERIYLNADATGHGIGKKLVELTFKIAREHHKEFVWLKAMDSSDGSIGFYKKMGFQISDTHLLRHPLMKEELRGMVIMKKLLCDKLSQ